MTKNTKLIEKEDIANFSFPSEEVLHETELKDLRKNNIVKGMKLGNLFKNKVHIIFEDSECLKRVETTIWGVTEKSLILKTNLFIPINRIHSITI